MALALWLIVVLGLFGHLVLDAGDFSPVHRLAQVGTGSSRIRLLFDALRLHEAVQDFFEPGI